jgi:hypothetical protein
MKNKSHGAINLYEKIFFNLTDIIKITEKIKSNNWYWKSSGQSIKTNVKQRDSFEFKLPNPELDYSKLLLNNDETQLLEISKNLYELHSFYLDSYSKEYGLNINSFEALKLLKYEKDQYFKEHRDDHPLNPRTISSVAYLNDNYIGGELYFKYFDFKYKPGIGDLIVFPSNYAYTHESLPLTEGVKYAIIGFWTEGVNHVR